MVPVTPESISITFLRYQFIFVYIFKVRATVLIAR